MILYTINSLEALNGSQFLNGLSSNADCLYPNLNDAFEDLKELNHKEYAVFEIEILDDPPGRINKLFCEYFNAIENVIHVQGPIEVINVYKKFKVADPGLTKG